MTASVCPPPCNAGINGVHNHEEGLTIDEVNYWRLSGYDKCDPIEIRLHTYLMASAPRMDLSPGSTVKSRRAYTGG